MHVPRYPRSTVEAIFGNKRLKQLRDAVEIADDGVRVSPAYLETDPSQELDWHPACEFEGQDGAPDPLEVPNLPFPCSAAQLAAFMIDGVGAKLLSIYGPWDAGPDAGMLKELGQTAAKPKEALRSAYKAYRDAEGVVSKLDVDLQERAYDLSSHNPEKWIREANKLEGVFEPGIGKDERKVRRERALASAEILRERAEAEVKQAAAEFAIWRKAMVLQLLQPEATRTSVAHVGRRAADDSWKQRACACAAEIIEREHARDLYPNQQNIADEIAKRFRRDGVMGADGKPLSGATIKRHALCGVSSAQNKRLSTAVHRGK